MPKLLQIDSCLGVGSTGRISESIAKLARKQNWDTYIIHGSRYIGNSNQKSIAANNILDEYIHIVKSLCFDNHGLNSKKSTKRLIKKIENINPDIIHIHCLHGYYINYRILFEFLANYKKPIIWTQHDCWAFTGHCGHFISANCSKWMSGCNHCPLKKAYPKSLFLDRSKRNWMLKKKLINNIPNLTIVSVSEWLDTLVSKSFLSSKPHVCIYNGIDTSIFKYTESDFRHKFNLENKYIYLAAATSWSKRKGFEDYIKLSRLLKDNEVIVLIGLPPNKRKNIPQNILGLPRTENVKELVKWYSVADIVMNLSYQETFGLTTIEGMACGTPGIVYNCTASPELISFKTGIIVEPGDIDGVRRAINNLKRRGLKKPLHECQDYVLNNFDMKKQFAKYIDLYQSLIK